MAGLRERASKGAIWALFEKLLTQFVTFGVTLILARLLTPTDYGTVALITIFVSIAEVLSDSGFGKALVQKKNITEVDFNSVFYFSLVLSVMIYLSLFLAAPYIARFYNFDELTLIVRVISITIVFHCVSSIQDAHLSRNLLFNLSFRISIIASVSSAIVGISLAFSGFGPWALVWSKIANEGVGMISRWLIIAWRPKFVFSFESLGKLFSFGWRMLVSSLIARIYSNLYGMLIGKFYTKAELAYVNRARYLPGPLVDSIDGTLRRVSFPALAKVQDDVLKFREAMRMMMRCTMFWIFPMMCGCAVCAESLVRILYGEQWLQMVIYVQIMCFTFAIYPFHTINLQGIAALGRSDVFLWLEIVKKILGIVCISVTIRHGVLAIIIVSAFVMGPLGVLINSLPNQKLLNYSIIDQIKDVLPNLLACFPLAGICWIEKLLLKPETILGHAVLVVVQAVTSTLLYLLIAWTFRLQASKDFATILEKILPFRYLKVKSVLESYANS